MPKQSKNPYFVEGWLSYIVALRLLWEELNHTFKFNFLLTRNLSQDCLEHFFSVIRWRNGNNVHPDASEFASAYKAVVINQLLLPKKVGNVQADINKYLVCGKEVSKLQIVPKIPSQKTAMVQLEKISEDSFDANQISSIHWTTGWACSKLKHEACIKRITSENGNISEEHSSLAAFKRYNDRAKIQIPGEAIFKYFQVVCKTFEDNFETLLAVDTIGVKENLIDILRVTFKFPNIQASDCESDCPDICNHEEAFAEKLIMGVLCLSCAELITDKYLNMLISCKLSQMNSSFKLASDMKRRNTRTEKAKKLNISNTSHLMVSEFYKFYINNNKFAFLE